MERKEECFCCEKKKSERSYEGGLDRMFEVSVAGLARS